MNFLAVVVDEFDGARTRKMGEKGVAWGDFVWVNPTETHASADEGALFHFESSIWSLLSGPN